ncbi:hypothetical protein GCM10010446_03130 [Streptomyces enissocaesilis]|uniref:Uncharacterized protein n=1 Tax=Streptomyces enissocaesilis TaxID=332589 RepID=A0ABN3WQ84_9ACTN
MAPKGAYGVRGAGAGAGAARGARWAPVSTGASPARAARARNAPGTGTARLTLPKINGRGR